MSALVIRNAHVFDGENEALIENANVVIEDGVIREVAAGAGLDGADEIDAGGQYLMPGLLDLHFHAYSVSFNMPALDRMPKPLLVAHATKLLEAALARGFTTVRDPGGGDVGLSLAVEQGLIRGPRFYYGGKALSQTGGHGDMRHPHEDEPCATGSTWASSNGTESSIRAATSLWFPATCGNGCRT